MLGCLEVGGRLIGVDDVSRREKRERGREGGVSSLFGGGGGGDGKICSWLTLR